MHDGLMLKSLPISLFPEFWPDILIFIPHHHLLFLLILVIFIVLVIIMFTIHTVTSYIAITLENCMMLQCRLFFRIYSYMKYITFAAFMCIFTIITLNNVTFMYYAQECPIIPELLLATTYVLFSKLCWDVRLKC